MDMLLLELLNVDEVSILPYIELFTGLNALPFNC